MAVPKGFDVPFRMYKEGCSPNIVEQEALIDRSIRTILRTYPGERVYRPNFGSTLRALIFANMTQASAMLAVSEIRRAVREWEPRASIDGISFDLQENTISVIIRWRMNGSRIDSTTSVGFAI